MSEMIERVARAIYEQEAKEDSEFAMRSGAAQQTFAYNPHSYGRKARAAIEAMREPTSAMVRDGDETCVVIKHAERTWRAMINAALAP